MKKVPHSRHYRLNLFVMNFIQWLEEPKIDDTFKKILRGFWGNVIKCHVEEKRSILNEKRDIQLAVQIGSNKMLINSLLPLLGKKYTLMPLFEHALKIIDEQFCHNGVWYEEQRASDVIFAYSYLTKVVYCPEYHPTSLLMRHDGQNTYTPPNNFCSARCSEKLLKCGKRLEVLYKSVRNDIKVAEAFAHYNALSMLTSCTRTPWKPFLFDLAMIITTANIQCEQYCKRIRRCSCGTYSPIELGLFNFLINENNSSKHYLKEELLVTQMTDEYYHCQAILKTLAVMTIHVITQQSGRDAQSDSTDYFKRIGLDYSRLDPTCYLGVMEDLILPFLQEVYPKQNSIMILVKKHQKLKRENILPDHDADAHPLSRYVIFFGLTALKTTQLQEQLEWPEEVEWIKPREAWVCSIIRDKTKKCQGMTKLPLLSQMKSTEALVNDRIFFSIKYLMKEEEFFKWDEKVKNIPGFYQFMSI